MSEARNEALEMHKAIFAHKIHSYCDLSLNISVVNDWVLKMIEVGWVGGAEPSFAAEDMDAGLNPWIKGSLLITSL